jgi:hypothetical protein
MPEILKRAAATAAQAGVAVLLASGASEDLASVSNWKLAALAAGAGLLSFAHRTLQTYLAGAGPAGT